MARGQESWLTGTFAVVKQQAPSMQLQGHY
jgi:hypothetical protein